MSQQRTRAWSAYASSAVWVTALVVVSTLAAPAQAAAKPKISKFASSRTSVAFDGGKVTISGAVSGATRCAVAVSPAIAMFARKVSCARFAVPVQLPANNSAVSVSYRFTLTAQGSGGASKAKITVATAGYPKPEILSLLSSDKNVKADGGTVILASSANFATTCAMTLSPDVSGLPPTVDCAGAFTNVILPPNNATTAQTYVVTMTAAGPGGISTRTANITIDAKVLTVPGAPVSPTAAAANQAAVVTWASPRLDGGSRVTGYLVTASPGSSQCETTGAITCTVTGLTNGTAYTFAVRARNEVGLGEGAVTSPVIPSGIPAVPLTLRQSYSSASSIRLAWTDPANNGSAIDVITVKNQETGRSCTAGPGVENCLIDGLAPGTGYTFIAKSHNANGDSAWSSAVGGSTESTVPGVPSNFRQTDNSRTSIRLSWTDPASNGSPIDVITVRNQETGQTCAAGPGAGTCTFDGLAPNTGYTFIIKAHNALGDSAWSSAVIGSTASTIPAIPSNLRQTDKSLTTVKLSWTDPASNGSPIDVITVLNQETGRTCTAAPGVGTCVIDGLTAGTEYSFVVKAHNANGDSAWSSAVSGSTASIVPGVPSSLRQTDKSGTAIRLSWADPASNGSPIDVITVMNQETGRTCTAGPAVGTCVIDGLTPATLYTFVVKAHNANGDSAWSGAVSGSTSSTVPGVPTNLRQTDKSSATVRMNWNDPPDNGSPIDVITVKNQETGRTCTAGPGVGTCIIDGLTPGSGYTFVVKAHNANGDSDWSTPVGGSTASTFPGVPANLRQTDKTLTSVKMSWSDPSANGSAIDDITVLNQQTGRTCTAGAGVGACVIDGLNPGTDYTFVVKAHNANGDSAWSAAVGGSTSATPPGVPTNLRQTDNSQTAVRLNWNDPASNGRAIDVITVLNQQTGRTCTAGPGVGTCVIDGLNPGTSYTFVVKAHNAMGDSAWSGAVSGNTQAPPRVVTVSQGSEYTASWCYRCRRVMVTLSGFAANSQYRVRIFDGHDGEFGITAYATTDGNGNYYGNPGGAVDGYWNYGVWAIVDGVESAHNPWPRPW